MGDPYTAGQIEYCIFPIPLCTLTRIYTIYIDLYPIVAYMRPPGIYSVR